VFSRGFLNALAQFPYVFQAFLFAFRAQNRPVPHFVINFVRFRIFKIIARSVRISAFANADRPHFHFENADCPHFGLFANVSKNWRPYLSVFSCLRFRIFISKMRTVRIFRIVRIFFCGSAFSVPDRPIQRFGIKIDRFRSSWSKSAGSAAWCQNRQIPHFQHELRPILHVRSQMLTFTMLVSK
jgi:hypothetical protein